MQRKFYEDGAKSWSVENRNDIVGLFDSLNDWEDFKYLFKGLKTKGKIALDFGCGPGRNIVFFNKKLKRIDGVDLSQSLLDKAQLWLEHNGIEDYELYLCNGVDLKGVPSNTYDFVFSTITLHHICVWEIRFNYFKEFYRVLKKGGWFTAQMAYDGKGVGEGGSVDYYENYYEAEVTNSSMDTQVTSPKQLEKDLKKVGFKDFKFWIRPPGPGEWHKEWIFFRGHK